MPTNTYAIVQNEVVQSVDLDSEKWWPIASSRFDASKIAFDFRLNGHPSRINPAKLHGAQNSMVVGICRAVDWCTDGTPVWVMTRFS